MGAKIKPTTLPAGKYLVRVYDPDNEVWSDPCGFTSKGLQRSKSVQETVVPYCDDIDAVAETERIADAKSTQFTGSGILAMESRDLWERFYDAQDSWLVRIQMAVPKQKAGGYHEGEFVLTQMDIGAERGKPANLEITLLNNGAVDWHHAPA
jgi:predicted secreted protein